jgi:hypothetical protein
MKTLLASVILLLLSTEAFAIGADLTAVSCPGDSLSAASVATLDCAGGTLVTLVATFQPAESISDLVGLDMRFDVQIDGDLDTDSNFWDFARLDPTALRTSALRPATPSRACAGYTGTWDAAGSGVVQNAAFVSTTREQVAAFAYRPPPLSVVANAKLFACTLVIDPSTQIASGGVLTGCCTHASITFSSATPRSASGLTTTPLTSGSLTTGVVSLNSSYPCQAVPVRRHSWGQLKSLYR